MRWGESATSPPILAFPLKGGRNRKQRYCVCSSPAARITFCHFAASALTKAEKFSGVLATASDPWLAMRSRMSGRDNTRTTSRESFATISAGVPAGANRPVQPVITAGFALHPAGFFAENPAMNLPDDAGHDVQDNDPSCCCS